jgi:hypothetical protein
VPTSAPSDERERRERINLVRSLTIAHRFFLLYRYNPRLRPPARTIHLAPNALENDDWSALRYIDCIQAVQEEKYQVFMDQQLQK